MRTLVIICCNLVKSKPQTEEVSDEQE
jgi:hypothetical protein